MKKTLLTLAFLAVAALPASADITGVVYPNQVVAGQTFTIDVQLTDIFAGRPSDLLIAFGFNFNYDSTALDLLNGAADSGNWFDASNLAGAPPQIIGINFSGFGAGTVEPLLLATLTLQALRPGVTNFSLTSDPLDLNTGTVFDNGPYGDINVQGSIDVVAAPEPAAVWLFGSVVAAWAAKRAFDSRREARAGRG